VCVFIYIQFILFELADGGFSIGGVSGGVDVGRIDGHD